MNINVVDNAVPAIAVSEEKLSQNEREDLFMQLLLGQEATGEVETSRGKFTVKFPKEKDLLKIGRLMSLNRGGLPVASFDTASENRNLICSTLNVVVTAGPEWLDTCKKKNPNFNFEEVPDDEFLVELYQKAGEFRSEVQKRIRETGGGKPHKISAGESMDASVGTGLFDGVTGSTTD